VHDQVIASTTSKKCSAVLIQTPTFRSQIEVKPPVGMDPLSITLALVTFATALKDIIELSQKIEQSFSKVSPISFVILDGLTPDLHDVGIAKHGERPEAGG